MRTYYSKVCPNCNGEFLTRRKEQRFCSRSCGVSFNNTLSRSGENHPLYKSDKKEYTENPKRKRARHLVEEAIRRGNLHRQPCSVCGSDISEAHHSDYENALAVEWYCRKHHRQADYRDETKAGDFGHR